jgi:hypothetical protein
MSDYSPQVKTLIILPKVTGGLSMLGSAYIFQDVVRTHKKRGDSVYHRILMGMSVFDFTASLMNFLSSWPTPADTGVYLAAGNTQTCTAAGFFNELGNTVTPVYNASLCMYYVLIIRKSWGERKISRYEALFHAAPLTIGWTFSLVALGFKTFNPAGWNCWLASYPKGCSTEEGTCTRGQHVLIFRWMHYVIIWSAVLVVTAGMLVIWYGVYQQERATAHLTNHRRASVAPPSASPHAYRGGRSSGSNSVPGGDAASSKGGTSASAAGTSAGSSTVRRRTSAPVSKARKVMMQAFYFCGAMYLTWIFTTVRTCICAACFVWRCTFFQTNIDWMADLFLIFRSFSRQ